VAVNGAGQCGDGGAPMRFPLAVLPTPLVRADRLTAALATGPLLVKRDDLTGFGAAGNKARALEHLIGQARRVGAEALVACGGPGSNFVAAVAMAAKVAGLDCEIVLWGDPAGAPNVALARAAGARIVCTGSTDRAEPEIRATRRAAELTAAGTRAVAVPRGGSTPVGALGFAAAATELAAQLAGVRPAAIVLPVGSGGSCAGLLAGLAGTDLDVPVVGVSVSRPPVAARAAVLEIAAECAVLRGGPPPRPDQLELVDAVGAGFGITSAREDELARLALHTEGLLLDATYGAKTFAVAVELLQHGPAGPVLWWHTGGVVPAVAHLTKEAVP